MNKKSLIFTSAAIIIIISLSLSVFLVNLKSNRIIKEMEVRNTAMKTEMDLSAQNMDLIRQNLMLLSSDSNTVRQLLNIPERNYPSLEKDVEETNEIDKNGTDSNILFFQAVERIIKNREMEEKMVLFSEFLEDENFRKDLEYRGLTAGNTSGLTTQISFENEVYFYLEALENGYQINTMDGISSQVDGKNGIISFIDSNIQEINRKNELAANSIKLLDSMDNDKALKDLLESRNLVMEDTIKSASRVSRKIFFREGDFFAELGYIRNNENWIFSDKDSSGEEQTGNGRQGFEKALRELISSATEFDPRSPGDIAEEDSRIKILELSKDQGFAAYLKTLDASISGDFREDHYYYYLDIIDENNRNYGSLAVQKHTGEIYLMDKDDVVITSFKTLGLNEGVRIEKKITLPEDYRNSSPIIFGDDDIAFVLIGANEANTDTIMVVHLNSITGKGTIITVPRDLYYKGRKINSIYPTFGPAQMLNTLSEITGIPVKRYVFIDMFAFADVVDIIGGIDIELREPLIDPTYRVKENGVWSTLHYEAGKVHLGGVEALRVARSRHTSSDFGRAERQIMLLMSLKEKILQLNAGDAGSLLNLLKL